MMSNRGMANPFGGADNFGSSFDAFEQELMSNPAADQKPPPTGQMNAGGAGGPGPGRGFPPTSAPPAWGQPQLGPPGMMGPPPAGNSGPSIIPSPAQLQNQTVMSDMFEPAPQAVPDPSSRGQTGSWFGMGSAPAMGGQPPVMPATGGPSAANFQSGGAFSSTSNPQSMTPATPPSGTTPTANTSNPTFGFNSPSTATTASPAGKVAQATGGPANMAPPQGAAGQFDSQIAASQQRQRGAPLSQASSSASVGNPAAQQGTSNNAAYFSADTSQEMKNVSAEAMQAMGINNPMASMAMSAGVDQVAKNATVLTRYLPSFDYFRSYFAVNHMYVLRKLGILVFPFKKGKVDTQPDDSHLGLRPNHDKPDGEGQQIVVLKSNVDDPELYVPSMGALTYLVLITLHMALTDQFHPDVFTTTIKWCVVVATLENGIGRLVFLTINSSVSLIDLVAFNGYKYVTLSVLSLLAMFLPYVLFMLFFAYFAAAAVFAEWRFLSHYQPFASDHARQMGIASNTGVLHKQVILVLSVLQVFLIWFMLPSFSGAKGGGGQKADINVR
ncbi:unnamed protein product [Amoebophrya sp. A120]|nr:unnamed protein product [Amoebophrya sp. A120]|eukprot:GSA120T00023052001.1